MTTADWENILDEDPGDGVARYAYADWLREQGRDREADLQVWLAETGRYPFSEPTTTRRDLDGTLAYGSPRYLAWGWTGSECTGYGAHCQLPEAVSVALRGTVGNHWPYESRKSAESALLQPWVFEALFLHEGVPSRR